MFGRSDKFRFESVVILYEVIERAVSPHALFVSSACTCLLDCIVKSVDGVRIRFPLDLPQDLDSLFLSWTYYDKSINCESDFVFSSKFLSAVLDIFYLGSEAVKVFGRWLAMSLSYGWGWSTFLSVHEVPVRDLRAIVSRIVAISALEDFRVRLLHGFRAQLIIPEAIKIASERETFILWCSPDTTQTLYEFLTPSIPLRMLKPPLSNGGELRLEPSAHNIYADAAIRIIINASNLLRGNGRIPRTRKQRSD